MIVINAADYSVDIASNSNYQYYDQKFDDIFEKLYDKILKYKKTFESNNYSKDSLIKETKTTIMIIGISDLMNKISVENKLKFGDLFNFTKNMGVIDCIIVDSINQIKKIEFESWFKESVNIDNGIIHIKSYSKN